MATVFDNPFNRQRLYQLRRESGFAEDQRFGRCVSCDCTSYSYFLLSMVLFSVGTVITVLALDDSIFYFNLRHMWLVGLIFICSGMMVAVNSLLYLRRKSVKLTLLHRRTIFVDLAAAQDGQNFTNSQVNRKNGISTSMATLPPAYDALSIRGSSVQQSSSSTTEIPPPTYEKAMFLIGDEKVLPAVFEMKISQDRESQPLSQIAEH